VLRGVAALVVLQIVTTLGPAPPSPTALVLSVLLVFIGVAWATARTEQHLGID
jgi:hypothetical protein